MSLDAIREVIEALQRVDNFRDLLIDADGGLHVKPKWGYFGFDDDMKPLAEIAQKHKLGIHFEGTIYIFKDGDEDKHES